MAGDEENPQSLAFPSVPRLDEVLAGEGSLACSDGVGHLGLAAAADRRSLGTQDLDSLFAGLVEEGGQPGAITADSFHRPATTVGDVLAGELQQAPVAAGVRGASVVARAAPMGLTAAAARVSRWVSTPMTPSTGSASAVTRLFSFKG
ncbi:hypothetical protein ACH4C6_35810 [Streptomyces sp. NPDC017943]|uniref:hypothetical protein n=1 Tax=Streptomyces sp. NPDC017943 TaxID=3365019 RepID=UPI003789FE8B